MRMIMTRTELTQRRNIATLNRIFWKLPHWFTLATKVEVLPKKVFLPVPLTIASKSPRLHTAPR